MWWVKVLMVVWGVWMVEAKPEARGPTWAEVMGALPRKTSQHTVQKADNKNNYNDDYDSSFFGNSDYVYVDTDDENYKPPPPQPKDENPQAAERRTLDFLFHTFMDSNKPRQGNDGRPTRDTTTTTRRPTLIEAVFKTIDDHILEDLKEWSNYMSHDDKAPTTLPPTNLAQAAAIQQASPNNDELLLVTDEKGQQHIVTINDIVTSLGHLDEKTLTELLLPPQQNVAAVESNRRIFSPLPPSKLTENDSVLPQSKPVLLGTTTSNNIPRSVRHTGSIKNVTESENEVYMVQDEQGIVHVVSLNEILTSLSQLNEESVNELLFGPPDGTTNSLSSTPVIDPTLALSQSVLSKKTSASIPTKTHGLEAISTPSAPISNNPFPSAKVTSDHNKNSVSNHEASVFLNQQDSTQKAATQPAIPTKLPAQQIRGSLVRTDSEGNIYITPKPGQSYNIQDILAIAEQTAQPSAAELPPSTNTNNFLKQNEKEQNPHRGQEVLSFLAGSGAKLPTTIQPTVPTASALSKHQPNVNALQQSLIRAFQQQSPTNSGAHPLTQYLTSQPIIQPIVQPTLQPVTQPPPGGFGATLSGLFSRLLGYPEEKQQQVPQQLQPTPPTNNPEYINLVVKQQGRNNNDGIFGAVTIPLPKPIHYQQKKSVQLPNSLQDSSQSSPGDKGEPLPSILHNLSPTVQETLRSQMNNKPRFIPPGAQRQALSIATSRMDTGPLNTHDTEEKELPFTTTTSTKINPSLFANLPSQMKQKLRQRLLNEHLNTITNNNKLTPTEASRLPVDNKQPLERSSYAEAPYYSQVGGYSYDGHDHYSYGEPKKHPLLDIYLLADMTKVYKVGNTNLSIKAPKIGDASKFVDTHSHYGYHGYH